MVENRTGVNVVYWHILNAECMHIVTINKQEGQLSKMLRMARKVIRKLISTLFAT